jgi:transposase
MKILAIDLAKAKSLFCWFDTVDQSQSFKTILSTPQAFNEAFVEKPVDRVVIEVCDMAGWIMDLCESLSLSIQVVNANTEAWRWKNVKSKTDKTDAVKLARLSASNDVKLVYVPDRATRHWRGVILYRHRLVERRTRIKNSIHALLVAEGRAMKAGPEMWKPDSISRLRELAKPIGECSKDQLWAGHLWMELEQLDDIEEQIVMLDKKLNEIGDADKQVRRLRTIPGVGPRLGELVVAVIDDPHRFKNARQVGAYAGLTPRRYQSGQMDRSGRISKAGCGKLRKLLLEIAWGMLKHNPRGQKVFTGISKGQKTRRKQAATALGRRVLVWCWAMLRDGTDWRDPTADAAPANRALDMT